MDDVRKYVKDPHVMKFVNFYFEFIDKWLDGNASEKIIRDLKLTHTHKDIVTREMQGHSSCIFVKMLKPNAVLQKEIVGAILGDTFYNDILQGAFMKLPKLRTLEDNLADWDTGLEIAEEQHHPIIYIEDYANNIHVAHSGVDLFKTPQSSPKHNTKGMHVKESKPQSSPKKPSPPKQQNSIVPPAAKTKKRVVKKKEPSISGNANVKAKAPEPTTTVVFKGQVVVFSGFRNEQFKTMIESQGGVVRTAVSGATTIVITKKSATKESKSVTEAKEKGIKILFLEDISK